MVWRARTDGRDVAARPQHRQPGAPRAASSRSGARGRSAQLGRPSLDDNRLVYARATDVENVIVRRLLGAKRKKRAKSTLMRSRREGLSNPSIRGNALLYVAHTRRADRLKLASVGGRGPGRTLLSRRTGTLWSTALCGPKRAYVTLIHGSSRASGSSRSRASKDQLGKPKVPVSPKPLVRRRLKAQRPVGASCETS